MSSKKKEGLGKGIRALLGDIREDLEQPAEVLTDVNPSAGSVSHVALEQIEVNPFQPRADFDENALKELAESIKVHGVIQPITVRTIGKGKYQLISGERRLRASKLAGLFDIPAYIREADDQEMLEIALIENIQREDLNAIEIGINYKRLIDECNLTQEELGSRVGKDRSSISNYLRLLKLPPEIQKGIKVRSLSMGHARSLITIDDPIAQLEIYHEIINKDLSVRAVEELMRHYKKMGAKSKKGESFLPLAYKKIQDELSSRYSTRVKIKKYKGEKGDIVIQFYSDEDLNRILEILTDQ